jgi:chaperonin GroEL (HSP60 family)
MEVINKKYKDKVLTDIEELYEYYFLRYKNEANKNLIISLVNNNIDLITEELKKVNLSSNEQLDYINLLHDFTRVLETLISYKKDSISVFTGNIEDYPPYHLYKKSQSAFGKIE